MKSFILLMSFLTTLPVMAARVNIHGKTISDVVKTSFCELRVVKEPIIFGKDQAVTKFHDLFVSAKHYSHTSRKIGVGRSLKIEKTEGRKIILQDAAVESIEIFSNGAYLSLDEITFDDLERLSGSNLTSICFDDILQDM